MSIFVIFCVSNARRPLPKIQNHEGHHVIGGQGNYNVACPLTDHLVGTYVKEASWRPRVDAFLAKKLAKSQEKQEKQQQPVLA